MNGFFLIKFSGKRVDKKSPGLIRTNFRKFFLGVEFFTSGLD